MILLDTNIVSEAMRRRPDPSVMRWLGEHPPEQLHIAATTIGEIHFGLQLLDDDRRRDELRRSFEEFVRSGFSGRVLDFDRVAAIRFGAIAAGRRRAGRPITIADAQIAAIALVHELRLATRNTRDFRDLGLGLIDPFSFEP